MKTAAFEARVENGIIRLLDPATLPEKTRVIVVVPEYVAEGVPRIFSPRLVDLADADELRKIVVKETADDGV